MRDFIGYLIVFLSLPISAGEEGWPFSGRGTWNWDVRYRIEVVDQEDKSDDALASTLRTRLGYQNSFLNKFDFLIEFENVAVLGQETYNDTTNGLTNRPVVADPKDTEVNRLQVSYAWQEQQNLIVGRQRLILDDARFVGNVGWRQNEQTFDALMWQYKKSFEVKVAYVHNANRIFGAHHPTRSDTRMDSYLLHGSFPVAEAGDVKCFAYLFDLDQAPQSSHQNVGVIFEGQWPPQNENKVIYRASVVEQRHYQGGDRNIDVGYQQAKIGTQIGVYSLSFNYELLEGNGQYGFSTPFATGHAFNGWADMFLSTPAAGLQDVFARFAYKRAGWNLKLDYHDFTPDVDGPRYGTEFDGDLTFAWAKQHLVGLKFANFESNAYATDTFKFWLTYQWKH